MRVLLCGNWSTGWGLSCQRRRGHDGLHGGVKDDQLKNW